MAQLVDDNRKKKEESGDQSAVSEHFPTKTRLVRNRIPLDECQAIYLMPRFAADASIACEILEITFLARIQGWSGAKLVEFCQHLRRYL